MRLRPIDTYFLEKEEPFKSCLQFLRSYLTTHFQLTEAWKYAMPFYCYRGKMICCLWIHKKLHQPYIGFMDGFRIDHPSLVAENRAQMKILLIDPLADIPLPTIDELVETALAFYDKKPGP